MGIIIWTALELNSDENPLFKTLLASLESEIAQIIRIVIIIIKID